MSEKTKKPEQQKVALLALLKEKFGNVECERKFDWLLVPSSGNEPNDYPADYKSIVAALCKHRDRTGFCNSRPADGKLRCDFVIESKKLIIEYDERLDVLLRRNQCHRQ